MFAAHDVMTRNVVSIAPDTTVEEASDLMLRHHVSGLPVVDEQGQMAGLVTEFDLLKLVYNPQTDSDRVSEYMTTDVVSIKPDASMIEVADLFLLQRIRRLPVLENGRLVGLIARRDLIRFVFSLRERMRNGRDGTAGGDQHEQQAATTADAAASS